MYSFAIFVAFLFFANINAQDDCGPQGQQALLNCYRDFFNQFGLQLSFGNAPLDGDVQQAYQRFYNRANTQVEADEMYCQFYYQRVGCLGRYQQACLNVANMNAAFGSRNNLASLFYIYDNGYDFYQCGAGYQILLNLSKNPECAKAVDTDECRERVGYDASTCQDYADSVNCVRQAYGSKCGPETGSFYCNSFKSGFMRAVPQCASALPIC